MDSEEILMDGGAEVSPDVNYFGFVMDEYVEPLPADLVEGQPNN